MKLKPRLAGVASFVPSGSVVADIGTDHAYLPVHLVTEKNCPKVIAVEKSVKNTIKAKETVSLFNLGYKVDVRTGNGLLALNKQDGVEVVVLAGMGGINICRILMAVGKELQRYKRIILQPMGDLPLVRRWLFAQGFSFREKLAVEKGRFYEIIAAEKGKEMVSEPAYLELGPSLLKGEDPLVIPWLEGKIKHYEGILQGLSKARSGKKDSKWRYFYHRYQIIREVLENICQGK
ncbi:MAG: SAM-dependent methyltransferase [Firmicutes bacterium]|nr:SAM-dependent methyltransferase [Bacillota bacterium]